MREPLAGLGGADAPDGAVGNILEFRVRAPGAAPITLKPTNYEGCQHKRFTLVIDDRLRTVECSGCGEKLDPVQCLMDWASFYRRVDNEYLEMANKVRILEAWKRKIDKQPEWARMTDAERKMDFTELRAKHSAEGCPRERMWIDRSNMIRCYCGVGHNAQTFPKLAEEVVQAQDAIRRRMEIAQTARSAPPSSEGSP